MGIISHYKGLKKEIYVLFFGRFVTAMGSFVWPMLTFLLSTKIGLSDSKTSYFVAGATLLSLPTALLGGKLADRYNRKNIIIVFDTLSVLLFVISAIIPIGNITALLLLFGALFQIGESPAYDSLVADFSSTEDRERASSFYYLGYNLGFIFSATMAGMLFAEHTKLCFILSGLSILISTVIIFFLVNMKNRVICDENSDEKLSEYESPVDEKLSMFKVLSDRKNVILFILTTCIALNLEGTCGLLLPLQLGDSLGDYGATVYGYISSLNGFVCITFIPIMGFVFKKYSDSFKALICTVMYFLGLFTYSQNGAVWTMFLGMFLYTLGEVFNVLGPRPYLLKRVPSSHRGRVSGFKYVIMSLVSALLQFVIGIVLDVTDSNYKLAWNIILIVLVLAFVTFAVLYRFDRKRFPKLYKDTVI